MTRHSATTAPSIGRLVTHIARLWRRSANRRLQPFGLTEATWLPLIRIAQAEKPMRQKDLARSLSLDGSSIVRVLDNLQRAGLVRRCEGCEDRRAKEIKLTEEGCLVVTRVEDIAKILGDEATAGISAEELETTARVLSRLLAFFEADLGEDAS